MGYLMKEALKTLCGVSQWCYAIFWKFGCQNPKLLIWEECYYENSGISICKSDFDAWGSAEPNKCQLGIPAENRLHFLVTKMMMDHHVHVVGEGLVGRAAFTGSHQWIISSNYNQGAHPPEVLKEVLQQFSAGMQTIAVIPVLPHGVVQLASDIPIMENTPFVDDVKTLVLQLGCVPGIFLSENYSLNEATPKIGIPVGKSVAANSSGRSLAINCRPLVTESCYYKGELAETATYAGQISCSVGQIPGTLHSRDAMFPASSTSPSLLIPHATQFRAEMTHSTNTHDTHMSLLADSAAKAEVIPTNSEVWLDQSSYSYIPRSTFDLQPSVGSSLGDHLSMTEQQTLAGRGIQERLSSVLNGSSGMLSSSHGSNSGFVSTFSQGFGAPRPPLDSELYGFVMGCPDYFSNFGSNESGMHHGGSEVKVGNPSKSVVSSIVCENSTMNNLITSSMASGYSSADNNLQRDLAEVIDALDDDLYKDLSIPHSAHVWTKSMTHSTSDPVFKEERREYGTQSVSSLSTGDILSEGTGVWPCSGDDLFDILGIDFKNKLLNGSWNNAQDSGFESSITNLNKKNSGIVKGSFAGAGLLATNRGQSDNIMLPMRGKDHLLDAMISSIHSSGKQILDDNTSCKTTITNTSSSSVPNFSGSGGEVGVSGQMHADLFGFTKSAGKPAVFGSSSFKSEACKDGLRSYSQGSSLYGSQISSWIDQGHENKPTSSVSTGFSKKTDDTGKTNRKRHKPGENPRPRPKDRQMIQDRVKELREIVPNGAKCSIDALLERTIKHMLFLQSVTKHADKLKQSGESKIFSKETGDGGATWACEVGSQSMVCPIIVEDLNQPRQMLVEMLCEERGLFLEIADIIRGLGLTILKGVMEAQKDKIWARFAVEANRDVTRMEIFISLVRLLDQNIKNGVPAANGIDNDTVMAPQFPLHGTSIPVAGTPCGLQ